LGVRGGAPKYFLLKLPRGRGLFRGRGGSTRGYKSLCLFWRHGLGRGAPPYCGGGKNLLFGARGDFSSLIAAGAPWGPQRFSPRGGRSNCAKGEGGLKNRDAKKEGGGSGAGHISFLGATRRVD